jgi:YgiT-type zinc finger domain-containing protein
MKCVICKGTDIGKKLVDEEIKVANDIVLVSIELLVCNTCGERYYNQRDMKRIEDLRTAMRVENLPAQVVVGKVYRAHAAA